MRDGKTEKRETGTAQGGESKQQYAPDSTAFVGVFDLVLVAGTRRLNRLVVAGLLLLLVLIAHGTFERIEALLLRGGMFLRQPSTIPHAEFVKRQLVFLR